MKAYIESRLVVYADASQPGVPSHVLAGATEVLDISESPTLDELANALKVIQNNASTLYQAFIADSKSLPKVVAGKTTKAIDRALITRLIEAIDGSKVRILESYATQTDPNTKEAWWAFKLGPV